MGADVIYGDIWASMGEEDLIPERAKLLTPFRVTEDTLERTGNSKVLYMHCLPSFHDFETKLAREWQAKGVDIREVDDVVFRGPHSVVFDEAETGCTPSRRCWWPPSARKNHRARAELVRALYLTCGYCRACRRVVIGADQGTAAVEELQGVGEPLPIFLSIAPIAREGCEAEEI